MKITKDLSEDSDPPKRRFGAAAGVLLSDTKNLRTRAAKPEEWRVRGMHMHECLLTGDDISCAMGSFILSLPW